MAGPRALVAPPTFDPSIFGLLSVVQMRETGADPHWRNGVTWQDLSGMGTTTFDPNCIDAVPSGKGTPSSELVKFGATPVTTVGIVHCSPVGYSEQEAQARAVEALTRTEGYQLERAFATGSAGGSSNIVYPHLQADTPVSDTFGALLQCAATPVSGSTVLDVVEGIGRLEAEMADCWPGRVTLHVPVELGTQLFQWGVVKPDGQQLKTQRGNLVALGPGYPGLSPAGAVTPGALWVYATGPIFAYRGPDETFRFREELDRDTNELQSIVERTWVLGYTCCCLGAVPISFGGDITGQPNSAF